MLIILEGLSVPIQLEQVLPLSYPSLRYQLLRLHQVDINAFSVYLSGRLLGEGSTLAPCCGPLVLRAQSRVPGGKGGFGSQLKAIGAQIQKTTSREACRDLSGRRVRDVNAEKRFQQLAREEKRRTEERRQQQTRRREKRWAQRTNHPRLQDPQYYQSLEDNEQRVSAALEHGLRRRQGGVQAVSAERPVFRGMGEELSDSGSEGDTEPDLARAAGVVTPVSGDTRVVPPTDRSQAITTSLTTELAIPDTTPDNNTGDEAVPLLPDPVPKPEQEPIVSVPEPIVSVPEPIVFVPEPIISVPEPIVFVPELIAFVPEPIISAPEPIMAAPEPIELDAITSKEDLGKLSMEVLKITLMSFGLKCGGTLQERIDRLYTYKVTPKDQLMPSIFAAKGKSAGKKSEKR